MNSKKILIFGTFDGIHEGHLFFIKEAKKQGDSLVAIVARDSMVKELKGRLPNFNEIERINNLLEIPEIDLVLLGDPQIGTYNVLKEVKPNVVYLGYDQQSLYDNLNKAIKNERVPKTEIIIGQAHKPEIFHSSILNKKEA